VGFETVSGSGATLSGSGATLSGSGTATLSGSGATLSGSGTATLVSGSGTATLVSGSGANAGGGIGGLRKNTGILFNYINIFYFKYLLRELLK
jgi:hypothetical protein